MLIKSPQMMALVVGNNFGTGNMVIIFLVIYFSNSHGKSIVHSPGSKNAINTGIVYGLRGNAI